MANILAVDDEEDVRALLQAALARDGHTVKTLASGAAVTPEACRWADCILLDVMMPGEDGFATCARIRALAACPILFLTAKTQEADVLTGLGLGGDDYLAKPFRIAELRARVAAHLRRERRAPAPTCAGAASRSTCPARRPFATMCPFALPKGNMPSVNFWPCTRGRRFPKSRFMRPCLALRARQTIPPWPSM